MLKIRKSEERGHVQFTWLDTRHSFRLAVTATRFHGFPKFTSDQ
jgi:hypothetical protein